MELNATFLVTIITFIVFVFLMNKLLYVPVLSIMETRERFIDDNYRIAEENIIDERTSSVIVNDILYATTTLTFMGSII